MFRALTCSSSGGKIVFTQHLVSSLSVNICPVHWFILFRFGFKFGVVWISLSLVGGLFVSLFCIWQTDLKPLIAYSSVAHMSMVIGGIMT